MLGLRAASKVTFGEKRKKNVCAKLRTYCFTTSCTNKSINCTTRSGEILESELALRADVMKNTLQQNVCSVRDLFSSLSYLSRSYFPTFQFLPHNSIIFSNTKIRKRQGLWTIQRCWSSRSLSAYRFQIRGCVTLQKARLPKHNTLSLGENIVHFVQERRYISSMNFYIRGAPITCFIINSAGALITRLWYMFCMRMKIKYAWTFL
jgi:hypothetical protein